MALVFVAANTVLLAGYRWGFVAGLESGSATAGEWMRLFLYGARIDLALLALELAAIVLLALVVRARAVFAVMAALTYLHCVIAASNYFFFRERNLPLGEKLFAYLFAPLDLLVYGGGFLVSNPWVAIPLVIVTFGYCFGVRWFARRLPATGFGLPRTWMGRGIVLAAVMALAALSLDAYAEKRKANNAGFKFRIVNPRYYQRFDRYTLNQAAGSPLFDLLRVYAPAYLRPSYRDRVDPAAALECCRQETNATNGPAAAPLLQSIEGLARYAPLGIRNVVIIQVEGLSQSVLARRAEGRPVMKFLNQLAADGIYCPNIVQGFNATAGGVFTTATGFPKGSFQEKARRFTSYEMNARYGTLPRILGKKDYEHIFASGFRESYQEYVSFMSNQGFTSYGYPDIGRRLESRGKRNAADDFQGYFDHYFLEECAEILGEVKKPAFVMHLVALTSHSPWTVPPGFRSEFKEPADRVFDYVDHSIESFIAALKSKKRMKGTAIVVIADHTSVTFGNDFMERVRVPMIIYCDGMKEAGLNREIRTYGSQMDVVPTILSLFPGEHPYAGFGRSLLAEPPPGRTLYSGFALDSWVFTGDWALSFNPNGSETHLYRRHGDTLDLTDVSSENAGLARSMRERLLSMYETSRRLAREQHVFPGNAPATAAE